MNTFPTFGEFPVSFAPETSGGDPSPETDALSMCHLESALLRTAAGRSSVQRGGWPGAQPQQ